jgi:hypothetical protein
MHCKCRPDQKQWARRRIEDCARRSTDHRAIIERVDGLPEFDVAVASTALTGNNRVSRAAAIVEECVKANVFFVVDNRREPFAYIMARCACGPSIKEVKAP